MKSNIADDDQHEEFLSLIRSGLRSIDDQLNKNQKTKNRNDSIQLISIRIRRFDQTCLDIQIDENSRIFQLKKQIEKLFENQKNLHWKSIWNRYLLFNEETNEELIDSNRRIRSYGIHHNSELRFQRKYRRK